MVCLPTVTLDSTCLRYSWKCLYFLRHCIVQVSKMDNPTFYMLLHTHTHPFNGPFSRTTWVSRYQKGKNNLDFTEARDSEWHWHQLGHMQICTLLQTNNHASTPLLSFLQAGCPSCCPTNSVKALKGERQSTDGRST